MCFIGSLNSLISLNSLAKDFHKILDFFKSRIFKENGHPSAWGHFEGCTHYIIQKFPGCTLIKGVHAEVFNRCTTVSLNRVLCYCYDVALCKDLF